MSYKYAHNLFNNDYAIKTFMNPTQEFPEGGLYTIFDSAIVKAAD